MRTGQGFSLFYKSLVIMLHDLLQSENGALLSLEDGGLAIGTGKQTLHYTQPAQPCFYHPDFFLDEEKPWRTYQDFQIIPSEPIQQPPSPKLAWQIEKDAFQAEFERWQKDSSLQKVVLYTFAHTSQKMPKSFFIDFIANALTLIRTYPLTLYACWEKDKGMMGLTPELLFSHSNTHPNRLQTMALAGTAPLNKSESLFSDQKLQHEHQLVVTGIKESIRPLGDLSIGSQQLLKLPKMAHLLTPLNIELFQPFNFMQAVQCLHPTPALGAFPKEEGMRWLRSYNQKMPRASFGAPFGLIHEGFSRCYVAIRQLQWAANGIRAFAGCGIVKQSLFAQEWREIELKLKSFIQASAH